MFKKAIVLPIILIFGNSVFTSCDKIQKNLKAKELKIGDKVNSLNGVYVYYGTFRKP